MRNRTILLVAIVLAAFATSYSSYATKNRESQPKATVILAGGAFKDDSGWLLTDVGLWTVNTTSGTWLPIELPISYEDIGGINALDKGHFWLLSLADKATDNPLDYTVYYTQDGGNSWQTSSLAPNERESWYPDIAPGGEIFFTDESNGWITLRQVTSSNFSAGFLFGTNDGGKTWKKLDIPSGTAPMFVDKDHGWTSSTPLQQMYSTTDGGISWQEVLLPIDKSSASMVTFNRIEFVKGVGYIHVTHRGEDKTVDEVYSTSDMGKTWLRQFSLEGEGNISTVGYTGDTWLVFNGDRSVRLSANGTEWAEANNITPFPISGISVFTNGRAWGYANGQSCVQPKTDCTQYQAIYETRDSGNTWAPVVSYVTTSEHAK